MMNIIIGDRNYLGLDYARPFTFENKVYFSLREALDKNACADIAEFKNLVRARYLQHKDIARYLVCLNGNIAYRSLNTEEVLIGKTRFKLEDLGNIYMELANELYYAGARTALGNDGKKIVVVDDISSFDFGEIESTYMQDDILAIHKILKKLFGRKKYETIATAAGYEGWGEDLL